MPCDYNETWGERARDRELKEVTQMLCAFLKRITTNGEAVPGEFTVWWVKHQEEDREREEEERTREAHSKAQKEANDFFNKRIKQILGGK